MAQAQMCPRGAACNAHVYAAHGRRARSGALAIHVVGAMPPSPCASCSRAGPLAYSRTWPDDE